MAGPLRTLVVGCGHMGVSHARAYHGMPDAFTIVGLVSRGDSRSRRNADHGGGCAAYADVQVARAQAKPDVVCSSTYTETQAGDAKAA
ncbi:MAG: Gfo/Idh/MocA family oxidoreductase, partial [Acidobacteria bacterium]|nr:Gfo/Idh/MocA family oxidoreductase [Acidobacteriota bacterium]